MLRARSESFTESDASYASSSADSSGDVSTSSEQTESTATPSTTHNSTAKTTLNKAAITHVTVPRKIVIKYSSNIETPKVNPPLAIIGTQNSESSDAGISESEYTESVDGDETTDEPSKAETTVADVTEISDDDATEDETETDAETEIEESTASESVEEDDDEDVEEEEEEEEDEDDEDEEDVSVEELKSRNGYTNGVKKYALEDFTTLKTIGEYRVKCLKHHLHKFSRTHILHWQ